MSAFDSKVVSNYISKGKEILERGTLEEMKDFYNKSLVDVPIEYCTNCEYDNLGNCYNTEEKKFKICFANWLKNLEQYL